MVGMSHCSGLARLILARLYGLTGYKPSRSNTRERWHSSGVQGPQLSMMPSGMLLIRIFDHLMLALAEMGVGVMHGLCIIVNQIP